MNDRPIHEAAQRGDVAALRRELEDGVSANALGSNHRTPLHYLYLRNDNAEARVECVHMLIEAGADVNAPTPPSVDQNTPLHFAADCGHAKLVAALIKAGADVNRGNNDNITPLHFACCRSDSDGPALLLLRNGAAVDARTSLGLLRTPLDWAIHYSSYRLVPILLRAGAALPAETDDAYIQKVIAAGGFETYKRIHLDALAASFVPKFAHRSLPPEMVRRVVEYAFHVGYY